MKKEENFFDKAEAEIISKEEEFEMYEQFKSVMTVSKKMEDMIKEIDKGILLCRFSGGSPSDNGDFSGVAKNSFYIENGEVQYPISETMVSGNIVDMFQKVKHITTIAQNNEKACLLYTSDAADERSSVANGGRRIRNKK